MVGQTYSSAEVYVDGCCLRNGSYDAQMGVGVYWPGMTSRNQSKPIPRSPAMGRHTNQRAELLAAQRGAQQALDLGYDHIRMHMDSQYVVDAINEWVPRCVQSGGDCVNEYQNGKDMLILYNMLDKFPDGYVLEHVYREQNTIADSLARKGAMKAE